MAKAPVEQDIAPSVLTPEQKLAQYNDVVKSTGNTPSSTVTAQTFGAPYPMATIYDQYGNPQSVYTSGPQAGRTAEGSLIIQGEAPKPGKKESNRVTNADGSITVIYSDGSFDKIAAPAKQDTGVTQSAKDYVNAALRDAGLAGLSDDAWKQWTSGATGEQIMDWVRQQPSYAERFPAMAALRAAGRSISEAQYVAKEQADIDLMTSYGIPSDIATSRSLLGKLIQNNVNVVDLQKRLIAAQDSILSKDKSVLDYASKAFGLTTGDLMAFALNPEIATPIIEQKAKAIQIGGAAFQASQALGAAQAMQLAAGGVTAEQAKQGFLNTAQQQQLTQALPGDVSGSVTQEELVNAQFGMSPEAIAKAKKVAGTRAAEYQGGGQYVSGQGGITGIGSAPQV